MDLYHTTTRGEAERICSEGFRDPGITYGGFAEEAVWRPYAAVRRRRSQPGVFSVAASCAAQISAPSAAMRRATALTSPARRAVLGRAFIARTAASTAA